jgi:arylsulfatase A-like enzyme
MDEQLGRILDVLEQRKMFDDTLILFISDHGDMLGTTTLGAKATPTSSRRTSLCCCAPRPC